MTPLVLEPGTAAKPGRLLLLVTPELKGPDVLEVQKDLLMHGDDPGPLDGIYGPTTAAAVRAFQRAHVEHVDGVVGAVTYEALTKPPTGKPVPLIDPPGVRALAWMAERIGMGETPPGSNINAITEEFRLPGEPWCCMTVSLAFKHGADLTLGSWTSPSPWGYWLDRGFAYVPALEAWLKSTGYWIGRTKPEPGDIACYLVPGETVQPAHVGLVETVTGPGAFTALEGNYANELARVDRHASEVVGFGRVRRTK